MRMPVCTKTERICERGKPGWGADTCQNLDPAVPNGQETVTHDVSAHGITGGIASRASGTSGWLDVTVLRAVSARICPPRTRSNRP